MRRPFSICASVALLATFWAGPRALAQSPPSQPLGGYYLALGDSLAYGVVPAGNADPTCMSATAPGYVCQVYGYLHQIKPIQLQNLALPEMTSCVLVQGSQPGSPCSVSSSTPPTPSPVDTAVAFIKAHPGQVNPITINVGGADLVPLLPAAVTDPAGTATQLPALFRSLQANLSAAVGAIRAAAGPDTEIILVTQYNPLGGIPSPPLPAGLPDIASGAIGTLNQVIVGVASHYGARVADVDAAFSANPGGAATLTLVPASLAGGDPSKIDIYPTLEGYGVYARTVLKTSGFTAPLKAVAKLKRSKVKRRHTFSISGTTIADATFTIRVKLPGAHSRTIKSPSFTANNHGHFSATFSSGRRGGKGSVRVCATDLVSGRSVCSRVVSLRIA